MENVLSLFILRREKLQVESLRPKTEYLIKCPMTQLQRRLYMACLRRDVQGLREAAQSKAADAGRANLSNLLMALRKVADHPYLMRGVEPQPL